MTTPICFLDLETDGVHPGRKVWEAAMIRRDRTGQSGESFFVEIDLSTADPFGLSVGRFYERHPLGMYLSGRAGFNAQPGTLTGYETRAEAAAKVARMTHGAHIVGAVPNFDTETLTPLLREHGLTPAWHYHLIDVENLAVGYLSAMAAVCNEREPGELPGPERAAELRAIARPPWESDDLSAALGVTVSDEDRHTALGDAKWAMRIYDAVMGGTP